MISLQLPEVKIIGRAESLVKYDSWLAANLREAFEDHTGIRRVPVLEQPHCPPEFRAHTGEIETHSSAAHFYFEGQVISIDFAGRYRELLDSLGPALPVNVVPFCLRTAYTAPISGDDPDHFPENSATAAA